MGRLVSPVLALAVVAALLSGCATADQSTTTTAPLTTSSAPSTTTTTQPTTTTEPPIERVLVYGDAPLDLLVALGSTLSWWTDQRNPKPPMAPGLADRLLEMDLDAPDGLTVTARHADLETGPVAIITSENGDVFAAADDGGGWRLVGAAPAAGGAWFGEEGRPILVIGSDARPGQSQTRYRADSVHLLTARASAGDGAIVGIPRDSYFSTPYGSMKLSSVMAGRGPAVITDAVRDHWDIDVEGYVVTGFQGFERLMGELGNLPIVLPRSIPAQPWWPAFGAGSQTLSPQRVLEYSRTRKGVPGGDFTRSANQGVVMLAMLRLIQKQDIMSAPAFLQILDRHTWTDLPPSRLIQLAATAFFLDPDAVDNLALPGRIGTAGGGSVVFLDDAADAVIADLVDDGVLE